MSRFSVFIVFPLTPPSPHPTNPVEENTDVELIQVEASASNIRRGRLDADNSADGFILIHKKEKFFLNLRVQEKMLTQKIKNLKFLLPSLEQLNTGITYS